MSEASRNAGSPAYELGPGGSGRSVRYVVGTVDEIPPGGRKLIDVDGRSIGVFNVNGEYFALRNRCPHQGGELCKGRLSGVVVAPLPGEYQLTRPGEILRCPWHGWEFDIRTGQSWFDPRGVRVRRYDVSVEPGAALAADEGANGPAAETSSLTEAPPGPAARPATGTPPSTEIPPATPGTTPGEVAARTDGEPDSAMGGLARGPYVAETYPVSVEHAYIVIEIGAGAPARSRQGQSQCPDTTGEAEPGGGWRRA